MAGAAANNGVSDDGGGLSHAGPGMGEGFPTTAAMQPTKVENLTRP
jgi:hypothetical protein